MALRSLEPPEASLHLLWRAGVAELAAQRRHALCIRWACRTDLDGHPSFLLPVLPGRDQGCISAWSRMVARKPFIIASAVAAPARAARRLRTLRRRPRAAAFPRCACGWLCRCRTAQARPPAPASG